MPIKHDTEGALGIQLSLWKSLYLLNKYFYSQFTPEL